MIPFWVQTTTLNLCNLYGSVISVIFKSKPTNQVIRYKHKNEVSTKIMLEQKSDFLHSYKTGQL